MTHPYLQGHAPLAFAHRGVHGGDTGAGENSFEAFERAVKLGFTYLETDVHRTADGVVVALHDDTLDRTTNGEGLVAQRAWGEIQRLTVHGGGSVPRLDELLDAWPEVRWNLDVKDPGTVPDLVATLTDLDVLDRVCVGSFQHHTVATIRAEFGDRVCTAATTREVRLLVAAAAAPRSSRRALTFRVGASCVQVPPSEGRTRIVTDRFVETCHGIGLPVHVWTIDDHAQMRELLDLGVDGIMTDDADALVDVFESRGAWPPRDADTAVHP